MAPNKQRAAVITRDGVAFSSADVAKPASGQILVKIVAAAQNPSDCKCNPFLSEGTYGGIVGCDFAGTVEEIGPGVPEGARAIGERVAGFIFGSISPNGAFSEYVIANAEYGLVPIPDDWSFEEAAQLGATPFTALQALHEGLRLPSPLEPQTGPQRNILIWGGSSSIGQYTIQFAKIGGLRVITTASARNFDLVKGLGADEVYDYHDADVVQKIRAATGNTLDIAVDTISEGQTPQQVTDSIGPHGGSVAIVVPYESPRADVKVTFSAVPDLLKHPHNAWFVNLYKKILATGKIKPNPILFWPNGIAGVKDGLQFMQDGKVSAQKITYRIAETPAP
ncbi:dehydrogenase [Gloeopeniophorella convolvens]|nr:dehydrogenase [Gloeopeniophorella convolvens]KAI0258238.1 dehydrogenase [Gloeopeniophorella convolvens]